jgi:tetratricopeptide (TPR) repeat protein
MTILTVLLGLTLPMADEAKEVDRLINEAIRLMGNKEYRKALDALDRALAKDPNNALAYDHRGSAHFMLGKIDESVADFDRYLKLKPDAFNGHWRRGISL